MQVFIDARLLNKSGIGRYIRNIICETQLLDNDLFYIAAGNIKEIDRFNDLYAAQDRLWAVPYQQRIYSMSEQIYGSILVSRHAKCDLFFFPHYNVPCKFPPKSVVTIHDLIHFKLPQLFRPTWVTAARQVMRNGVKNAAKVIAISESTKNDLQEMFPQLSPDKINVIYQGAGPHFAPASEEQIEHLKQQLGLGKYILFVGSRMKHKNLSRLITAYIDLLSEIPDLQLVLCGQKNFIYDEVDQLKQSHQLTGIKELNSLDDKDLSILYSGAEAFVFPSLYEGFGLPPLEAMKCNTPVIVSNTSSLPEVVGSAGVYFDPLDTEDMGRQIYKVLKDRSLRDELVKKGKEQADKFSWAATAAKTLEVFREVRDNRR